MTATEIKKTFEDEFGSYVLGNYETLVRNPNIQKKRLWTASVYLLKEWLRIQQLDTKKKCVMCFAEKLNGVRAPGGLQLKYEIHPDETLLLTICPEGTPYRVDGIEIYLCDRHEIYNGECLKKK